MSGLRIAEPISGEPEVLDSNGQLNEVDGYPAGFIPVFTMLKGMSSGLNQAIGLIAYKETIKEL
jgi:hypothetical protein